MTRKTFGKLVMFGVAILVSMGTAKVASAQIIRPPNYNSPTPCVDKPQLVVATECHR